jgi:hypothetical protein
MGFNVAIQGPPAFLILAGIGFLIADKDLTAWFLIGVGAVLLIILTWIGSRKTVVVEQPKPAAASQ